jgi:hypothetical protein
VSHPKPAPARGGALCGLEKLAECALFLCTPIAFVGLEIDSVASNSFDGFAVQRSLDCEDRSRSRRARRSRAPGTRV